MDIINSITSASASTVKVLPQPRPQVFINFRGLDLRDGFISHLERTFTEHHINYYIDREELRSEPIGILLKRIKESQIALAIFSEGYADSEWCLDELVEIMKNVKTGNLRVIPVFFKGEFGVKLYAEGRRKRPNISQWEEALESVPTIMGLFTGQVSPRYCQGSPESGS
ncbi:PREDICTED: disease resistance protein LAZ5-like [Camelina sativa]|uniref:Disease resistance protein LAZ5-like n=1 Tax=Camelina sativa TaxID=90675 RepID=A0ABM1RES0_CAMSA|nr:PREDICTED: disease resistance protein LAZ5-like [Camelina sativa]